ncbi:NRDE family protein [Aerococcaceae bacterium 50-4]
MCLITFSYETDASYPFVLIANRDEAYSRPSLSIHEWKDAPDIIGGRDLQQGGTWLAFSKSGKFAALTNYPFSNHQVTNPKSRGFLINDYLSSDISPIDYVSQLKQERAQFDGYHLLCGSIHPKVELMMYNNVDDRLTNYAPGIHAISNTYDDLSAFRKSQSVKNLSHIMQDEIDVNLMIESFQNTEPNPRLKDFPSFLTLNQAKKASAIFVEGEGDFGTVSTTAIVLDKSGELTMKEVRYPKNQPKESKEIKYNFIK